MIELTLTPDEVQYAAMHGVARRKNKLAGLRADREQGEPSTWDNEIEGALVELAYCKWRNCHWWGLAGVRASDADNCEIRWTKHYGTGGLIGYRHDNPDKRFVLVEGFAPRYRVVGWLFGREVKPAQHLTPKGFFLAPRNTLRSMESLDSPERMASVRTA